MDPFTVIIVLAAHLLCSGGLLLLVAPRLTLRGSARRWGWGLVLFGGAYVLRLLIGLPAQPWYAPLIDASMVAAVLLFISGLRLFTGRAPLSARQLAQVLGTYLLVAFSAAGAFGMPGRHLVLNTCLGLLYAGLAVSAWQAKRALPPALHRPLNVLVPLMAGLAGLTLLRAVWMVLSGLGPAQRKLFDQVFYGYSSLAAVLMAMCLLWLVFEHLGDRLGELATHDPLTGVLNRQGLDAALRRHFGHRGRAVPLVVMAVDIDHFKRFNDSQGHAAGDAVLAAVAAALQAQLRAGDWVARVGGEEFLVCCPVAAGSAPGAVALLAERLRATVQALQVPGVHGVQGAEPGSTPRTGPAPGVCTISIGLSDPVLRLADWPEACAVADTALYAAKAAGRNRVLGPSLA